MGVGSIIFWGIVAWIGYVIIKKMVKSSKESNARAERQKQISERTVVGVPSMTVDFDQKLDSNENPTAEITVRLSDSEWAGVKYLVDGEHHHHINNGSVANVGGYDFGWDQLWGSIYEQTGSEAKADAGVNIRVELSEIWEIKQSGKLGTMEEKDCLVFSYHSDHHPSIESFKEVIIDDIKHLKALIENIEIMEDNKNLLKEGISEKIDI
jgi:hypothetical protein